MYVLEPYRKRLSRILIDVWEAVSAQNFGASFSDSLFSVSETCRLSDINEDSALYFPVWSLEGYQVCDNEGLLLFSLWTRAGLEVIAYIL